jgi:hypothetical protein
MKEYTRIPVERHVDLGLGHIIPLTDPRNRVVSISANGIAQKPLRSFWTRVIAVVAGVNVCAANRPSSTVVDSNSIHFGHVTPRDFKVVINTGSCWIAEAHECQVAIYTAGTDCGGILTRPRPGTCRSDAV